MDTASLNALTQTSNSGATAQSAAQVAGQQLAGNFDTFLKLLTTQLQHQDPTAPMDTNQFTQQLVEFAGVEQQINANDYLKQLVDLSLANSTSSLAGYIGQQVSAGGAQTQLTNGAAHWSYSLGGDATSTVVNIADASGKIVYTTKGELTHGAHTFSWDGRTNDGSKAPDGAYSMQVTAADAGGNKVAASTTITGVVSSVDIVGGKPMLRVGGLDIDPADITNVSSSASSGNSASTLTDYLGRKVVASGSQSLLSNGSASWTYSLGGNSANTVLNVTDSTGKTVYTASGERTSGTHTFTWNGRKADGTTAPDGTYTLSVNATNTAGKSIGTNTTVSGVVSAVDIVGGKPALKIGGLDIDTADVVSISTP
ncbi:MAG: FlgD immunoglobulin-like domain containing protein [Alphaproteobacteria bacterium]